MAIDLKANIIQNFEKLEQKLNGSKDSLNHALKRDAISTFTNLGFPTLKHEEWKYTNLNFIHKQDFHVQIEPEKDLQDIKIDDYLYKNLDVNLLVFINGFYSSIHSNVISKEDILLGSVANELLYENPILPEFNSIFTEYKNKTFNSMNLALSQDGAFINIPNGKTIEEPIHLLFINNCTEKPVLQSPRNYINIGENSEAKFIETTVTIGNNPGLINMVTEILMKESSKIEYNKIQNDSKNSYYISDMNIVQSKDSAFQSNFVTMNGTFIRNEISTALKGKGAYSNLNGFYLGSGNNIIDNHTMIDHAVANCKSDEIYKGIMGDTSHGIFCGKILVRENAQKTNAYQTNKNILLSNDAVVNSKPQLEIHADDVKCSHGATSGFLDEESIFYLRARGIGMEQAKALLLVAFAGEILNKISINPLKELILEQIQKRLII